MIRLVHIKRRYRSDEIVTTALDDINLHRFIKLVEGFARESQVIIVTHQKRTMEVAGMMYGVSMGKKDRVLIARGFVEVNRLVNVSFYWMDVSNPFPWVSGSWPVSSSEVPHDGGSRSRSRRRPAHPDGIASHL